MITPQISAVDVITPNQAACALIPDRYLMLQTLRQSDHSVSQSPFDAFNVAFHVGDDPAAVHQARIALARDLTLYGVERMCWFNQVHGTQVYQLTDQLPAETITADAAISNQLGSALVMMTADCLPLTIWDCSQPAIACIHAGWRGLSAGVIEQTVAALQTAYGCLPENLVVWMGAAIGPQAFEVGAEVFDAFVMRHPQYAEAFTPSVANKYKADIYALARLILADLGVSTVFGGEHCTVSNSEQFYSYRHSGNSLHQTGRMATVIALVNHKN